MSTKAIQGKLWSVAPQYWAKHFEPWFLPLYRMVLEQLKPLEDQLLLDDGCGSGLFSYMAIEAGAELIGVDAAPGLLEVARQRNPRNNFMEEDLEALPFADNSFHFVAALNSLQYAANFENALGEANRVLRPGGRLAIGIWDKPEMSDATKVLKAIQTLLPPPPPGIDGPFVLSEDGKIEDSCSAIGMKVIHKAKVACPFIYSSLADGIKSFMGTAPAAAAINNSNRKIVEEVVAKALKPFKVADEFHFLQNSFLIFIARK